MRKSQIYSKVPVEPKPVQNAQKQNFDNLQDIKFHLFNKENLQLDESKK